MSEHHPYFIDVSIRNFPTIKKLQLEMFNSIMKKHFVIFSIYFNLNIYINDYKNRIQLFYILLDASRISAVQDVDLMTTMKKM